MVKWFTDTFGPIIANSINTVVNVIGTIAGAIADVFNSMITSFRNIIKFVREVFTGDWKGAWETVKDQFANIFNSLVTVAKTPINVIIDLLNGLIGGVCAGINAVIRNLNNLSFDVPDWVPGIGGETFGFNLKEVSIPKIPTLARGAVIPANREFLAVLGDQKSGTNVEAPLATIEEAVENVLARHGYESTGEPIILQLDGREVGRVFGKAIRDEARRTGSSLVSGKLILG